jgi:hypothetical protein
MCVWELMWVLGRILGSSVGHRRERSSKFTGAASGGRRRTAVRLGHARGKKGEGFYRLDNASRRLRPSFMTYRSIDMSAEAVATCGGPTANGGRRFCRCFRPATYQGEYPR